MTDREDELAEVERAARDIVPRLTERLAKHHLGELEVRQGPLRVRVVAGADSVPPPSAAPDPEAARAGRRAAEAPRPAPGQAETSHGVTSPAVGYFGFADGLGPGLEVDKGDALGHVEMLGVRHDVRAPRRGTVRHLVAEAGEPVEYGQVLIEMEPGE
ncbi:MAG TPA: biotin/lipoyl-containing protein [Candidatus Limnocylindrales bacterium]|nr:biotin/lipoyl-containing protein [Candidatus Limnocylindrales bacterium]